LSLLFKLYFKTDFKKNKPIFDIIPRLKEVEQFPYSIKWIWRKVQAAEDRVSSASWRL